MGKLEKLIKTLSVEDKIELTYGSGYWLTTNSISNINQKIVTDGPHGVRLQNHDLDKFFITDSIPSYSYPSLSTLANSFDDKLVNEVAHQIGLEANSLNVSLLLAPGLNIKRDPRGGRNFEYFSEDPLLSGRLGYAYVKGVQRGGVGATIKHVALNNQETYRFLSNSVVDSRTFRELYFLPFKLALKAKPEAVMSSYNLINGIYATENSYIMNDLIRNELNYDGLFISDWGSRNDPIRSIKAGLNLEMPGVDKTRNEYILDQYKKGLLTLSDINKAVKPVLKFLLKENKKKNFDEDKAKKVALKAALSSIVLLKNEDKILPLSKKEKILVVGGFFTNNRYQGSGSSKVNPKVRITPNDAFDTHNIKYDYIEAFDVNSNLTNYKEALDKASNYSKILVFSGLPDNLESEGFDKTTLNLPDNYVSFINELASINNNIVNIVCAGSQTDTKYDNNIKGLLYTYLAGGFSGEAIYQILYGKYNPSARLAETFVYDINDTYLKDKYPVKDKNNKYNEGLYVGYSYYYYKNLKPKYEFGYGLSYNKNTYSNFKYENNRIVFDIKNNDLSGYDTIFLFVEDNNKYIRLKDYKKIHLNLNETKNVSFELNDDYFKFFSVKKNRFVKPNAKFIVRIGTSLNNILYSKEVEIKGEEDYASPIFELKLNEGLIENNKFSLSSTLSDFENTESFDSLQKLVKSDIDISEIKDEMTKHERMVAFTSTPLRFYTNYIDLNVTIYDLLKYIDIENKNKENEK